MTSRLRDWQSRLQACQAERWSRPFAWGSHDCALFAADCVQAVTGSDPAADLRGAYSDAAGAARVIARLGGLRSIGDARLGERVAPLCAQPGDIGLVVSAGRECAAVCVGESWVAPSLVGLEHLPIEAAVVAWRCTREDHDE